MRRKGGGRKRDPEAEVGRAIASPPYFFPRSRRRSEERRGQVTTEANLLRSWGVSSSDRWSAFFTARSYVADA
ncbi:hypothetical protein R1flu_024667 [Riccia fluitans]|uniref:Uncharacterized protein n=1 Tax=Riccia fluitans TaxID=41844 RepID=A0ABD1XVJ5_9MARC